MPRVAPQRGDVRGGAAHDDFTAVCGIIEERVLVGM